MPVCDNNHRMEAAKRAQQLGAISRYTVTGEALSKRIVSFLHTIHAYDVEPRGASDSGVNASKLTSRERRVRSNYRRLSSSYTRS